MIGDGMGLSQISAGIYSTEKPLAIEHFPVIGFHKTYSSDNLITDSAAGATAIACGVKTFNNAIGITPDSIPCQSILELAEERGLSTGLVATSSIVHATPAAFIAHQPLRALYESIAADFLTTEIDFIVGGGKKYFDRRKVDNRNLYKELENKGYQVSDYFQQSLKRTTVNPLKNFAYFTADREPVGAINGRDYLPFASKLAVNFLDQHSEAGFFVMIEGSQIDWQGHYNDGDGLIAEMKDFDQAIEQVLHFAVKDQQTLVIITADHETGGLSLTRSPDKGELEVAFTSTKHTAALVPVFAYGPGSELFRGIYENTEIYGKMRKALGLD